MTKFEDIGISPVQTVMAATFVVLGLIVYIGGPQSFISGNFGSFFMLMAIILMATTIGLVFLFKFVQIYLERFVLAFVMATFCRRDNRLKKILEKNLECRRRRNSKTALMFTFCICFLMYSGSSIKLIQTLLSQIVVSGTGADLVAVDPLWKYDLGDSKAYIDEEGIAEFLDKQQLIDNPIEEYSFSTPNMRDFLKDMGYSEIDI